MRRHAQAKSHPFNLPPQVENDLLTPEELEVATKVFGLLAKWKRERLSALDRTIPANSNQKKIELSTDPVQK